MKYFATAVAIIAGAEMLVVLAIMLGLLLMH
jgi:hypothetical protein